MERIEDMRHDQTLLINQSQVKELLTLADINQVVDETFRGVGNDTVKNPTKVTLDLGDTDPYPPYDGYMNAMPAYIGWQDIAGIKWVGGIAGEREEAGLPYILGLIILLNPHLGKYVAVVDGQFITNYRTGSQTAVALSYLMNKREISIGMFGTGTQARTNVMAIAEIFKIKHLKIWNHRRESAETYAEEMQTYVDGDIEIVPIDRPQDACREDVLITATRSKEPIVKKEWIKPGTIVFPLGSHSEVENDVITEADHIVVDHIEQALHRGALEHLYEAGEISADDISATLGALATHEEDLGDISDKLTICVPIGMGAIDVSVAALVYKRAREQGIGEYFDFLA